MFNGNIQDLEFSHVEGSSYRNALDNLEKEVMNHFKEFGFAVQPQGLGSKTINREVQNKKIPIEIESIIPRPFTYQEQARLIVESDQEIVENIILSNYKDTATSVAYPEGDNSQYKIIPVSKKLLTLYPGFNQHYVETDYKNLDVEPIKKGKEKYNKLLTDKEYNNHKGFIALIPDKNKRIEFRKKLKEAYKSITGREAPEKFMGFWLDNSDKTKDYERAVCLDNYLNYCNADASNDLYDYTRFLLVAPRKKN